MTASSLVDFIDSPARLSEFCASLRGAEWIAVDTEFLRERTYYPRFCLLQIAHGPHVACIDPLALDNLDPLADILFDPAVTKVLHAGRQDLEIFHQLWNRLPAPLFDTQIAAPLIGLAEQISYAGLVAELLGVSLSKTHSRTDWSLRPLSDAQLRYAADDVIYLGAAYQALRGQLEALDRLGWLADDFAALLNPALYETPPELAWQRIGGVQQLRSKQLAILQGLAAWREETARAQDIPRNWVVKDEAMVDLARIAPKNPEELKRVRGLEERTLKRYGNQLCQLICEGQDRAPPALDIKARSARRTPEEEALLDLLNAVVRLRAAQHTLNPAVLAGRKDLEQLLDQPEQSKLLKGWRKAMAGEELMALLRGECHIAVADGCLHVRRHA
ncbi:ribonuclease D [Methylomagnum sp.]